MLLKNAFIALFSFSILHADTLKECKTEEDIISGCVEREYHSNGKIYWETPFKNGGREGIAKEYYENGKLKIEIPYKNDKIEGIARRYYENGNLVIEVSYKNDELHGDLKYYTEDGKLLALVKGENGEIISGKCFDDKVLIDKELKEFRRIGNIDEKIIYLQEICLSNDSK